MPLQGKEKRTGAKTEVKASSAPSPGKQLFVRCLHSTAPGETWAIKNKRLLSIRSITRAELGLQLVMCYLFLVLIAGSPRNISVIYSARLSRSN